MDGLLGPPPLELLAFALVAAAMVALDVLVLLLVLPRPGGRPTLGHAFLSGYVLVASSLFWLGLPWAVVAPSLYSWILVTQLMMIPMPAPFLWMIAALYRAEEKRLPEGGGYWPLLLAGALVANELFMAIAYTVIGGGPATSYGALLGHSVNSLWFVVPMIGTMAALLLWVPLSRFERRALGGLTATMAVAPWFAVSPMLAAVAMGAVMGVALVLLLEGLARSGAGSVSELRLAIGIGAAFLAMAVAGALSVLELPVAPDALPFASTTLAVMLVEAVFLLRRGMSAAARSGGAAPGRAVAETAREEPRRPTAAT
ncbi:MAG: hypothetical protein L3K23_07745 [Thermoplasmata archaeon]|nr:hypothetical protein [Thermoplasmata archaeon]